MKLSSVFNENEIDENYLCDKEEIEKKFRHFCSQAEAEFIQLGDQRNIRRAGMNNQKADLKLHAVSVLKGRLSKLREQFENAEHPKKELDFKPIVRQYNPSIPRLQKSYSQLFYEEKIHYFCENFFRKKEERRNAEQTKLPTGINNHDQINYLIKIHGDFLQDSLMDALVLQTVQHKYKDHIPAYDHFGTAAQILQSFNISAAVLASKHSQEDRRNYILNGFQECIDSLMKEWKLKVYQKEKKVRQQEQQMQHQIEVNNEHNEDVFAWLNLKTKYDVLQKKLKVMLMEKINEYENQIRLIDQLEKTDGKNVTKRDKIPLEGVTKIKTTQIIQKVDPKEARILNAVQKNKTKNKNPSSQSVSDLQDPDQTIQDAADDFLWNVELEQKFQKYRKQSKKQYFEMINASNFNHLGLMPIFQKTFQENPTFLKREILLNKYNNAEWLTSQELKFLANTNKLLNSCVDQKFIKNAIKVIKPKSIQYLETQLAEKILDNYEAVVKRIQDSRIKFMKRCIQQKKQKINNFVENQEKKRIKEINKQHMAKLHKRLDYICEKMNENITIKEEVQRNMYAQIFVKIIQSKVKNIRQRKEIEETKWNQDYKLQQELKRKRKQKINEMAKPKTFQTVTYSKKYHPASKLAYYGTSVALQSEDDLQSLEGQQFKKRKSYMDFKIKEYKRPIAGINEKEQDNFVQFYSSGPTQNSRQTPFFDPYDPHKVINLNAKEFKSIVFIQKCVRKWIAQRHLQNHKEIIYQRKFKHYYAKLQDIYYSNKMKDVVKAAQEQVRKSNQTDSKLMVARSVDMTTSKIVEQLQKQDSRKTDGKLTQAKSGIYVQPEEQYSLPGKQRQSIKDHKRYTHTQCNQTFTISQQFVKETSQFQSTKLPTQQTQQTHHSQVSEIGQEESKKKKLQMGLLIKHQRLLRYSKMNMLSGIAKAGFIYTKDDVNVLDEDGKSPLYYACGHNNMQLIEYLIKHGADPNLQCSDNTPFHLAFKSGNINAILMLLDNGGNLNSLNKENQTPLMFASQHILSQLGLQKGVCSVQNRDSAHFDNSKFLKQEKQSDHIFQDHLVI